MHTLFLFALYSIEINTLWERLTKKERQTKGSGETQVCSKASRTLIKRSDGRGAQALQQGR